MKPGYRQGAVLGLTIAEIFILLVFLLLLVALVALSERWNEEKKREEEKLAVLQPDNKTDKPFITPEEIETLIARADAAERERDRYRDDLAQEKQRLEETEKTLDNALQERASIETVVKNIRAQATATERERDRYKKSLAREKQWSKKTRKELENALQEKKDAETALDVFRRKGENPPCWYETVTTREEKTREKAHYLLNVAVFDEGLVMAPIPAPPGAAKDDNGPPYAKEAEQLGVAGLPYGKILSDQEFTKHLKPLFEKGKQSIIRTYPCIFSVRVWDNTSFGAKARWKQAHDRVLEGMFGTYEVRNDPWPGIQ